MIVDNIENAKRYYGVNSGIKEGFDFLTNNDLASIEDGKHIINGDKIFAIVSTYNSKELKSSQPEAHNRYIDIQYIVAGSEMMGYKKREARSTISKEYNEENDILFYDEEATMIPFNIGDFFILFPQDLHQPGIINNEQCKVKKVVIKILQD